MSLRARWKSDDVLLGGWCGLPSAVSAEIIGRTGFDWAGVEMQHGVAWLDHMVPMLQGLAIGRTPAFVRVPWNEPWLIMRALDAGATGVIVPHVESAAEAARAVAACRYPPLGIRSWGPGRAAFGVPGYNATDANAEVICMVMIETLAGVDRVDEIVATKGLDGVFIGPADLSLSGGGQPSMTADAPDHVARVLGIRDACHRGGVVAGTYTGDAATTARWASEGFRFLALLNDVHHLTIGAAANLEEARAAITRGL
jgi:4-hydroxy-2-oxoheptanedioate aldolase